MQIIRRANELGEDPLSLSNRFCQEYVVDMADLLCLPPTHEPRVSDHMEQIKDMITQVVFQCSLYLMMLRNSDLSNRHAYAQRQEITAKWRFSVEST